MLHALGLHLFYSKRSNKYKDKDEGGEMDIPPNTMESDSLTTLQQDSIAISGDDVVGGCHKGGSSDRRPPLRGHP